MPSALRLGPDRGPALASDVIIELAGAGIVLVERRFEPAGWALPGGFVEYGESLEDAARREAKEETGLDVFLHELFHAYSAPDRDARGHVVSVVFIGSADGEPVADDDAKATVVVTRDTLPQPLAFDHGRILRDYFRYKETGRRPVAA